MKQFLSILLISILFFSCVQNKEQNKGTSTSNDLDRTVLPLKEPTPPKYTELSYKNATPPKRFEVKAPKDAPNVVIVLVDDLGFAGTSKFGGPVATPTFDKMASEGIFYNNFHTTAVCSPTRSAIKVVETTM